jgi:hypothetical protein
MLNFAPRPKFILGLKAETKSKHLDESDSDGVFFSSDSGEEQTLAMPAQMGLTTNRLPRISPVSAPEVSKKLSNFSEASGRITTLISVLEGYSPPEGGLKEVYIVPETTATAKLTGPIGKFLGDEQGSLLIEEGPFDDNIAA